MGPRYLAQVSKLALFLVPIYNCRLTYLYQKTKHCFMQTPGLIPNICIKLTRSLLRPCPSSHRRHCLWDMRNSEIDRNNALNSSHDWYNLCHTCVSYRDDRPWLWTVHQRICPWGEVFKHWAILCNWALLMCHATLSSNCYNAIKLHFVHLMFCSSPCTINVPP